MELITRAYLNQWVVTTDLFMIEVFKTNVNKKQQSILLIASLQAAFPSAKFNFDLKDCDRVLRVEGLNIEALHIVALVNKHGFLCEPLV